MLRLNYRLIGLVLPCFLAAGAGPRLLPSGPQTPAAPPAPIPPQPRIVLPGGIGDAGGRTGFFTSPQGGIDAVDLVTGDLLWSTIEAEVPLLVANDRLIAQAGSRRNRLRILVFDLTRRGECLLESDPVVLPSWVVTGEAPGHSFTTRWQLEHGQLVLHWEAKAWPPGKTRLSEARRMPVKQASGQATIDLGSGQVQLAAAPAAAAPVPPHLELLHGLAVRWHGQVGDQLRAIVLAETMEQPPAAAAPAPLAGKDRSPRWAGQYEDPDARAVRVPIRKEWAVLYSWDVATHRLLRTQPLCSGQHLQVHATLDQHYVCIRPADLHPSELGGKHHSEPWRVYDLATGQEHARVAHEPGMSGLVLQGRRAYYTVPEPMNGRLNQSLRQLRALKAIDLKSGRLIWQRVVAGKLAAPPSL